MKIYRKSIEKIGKNEIVAGHSGSWWRVTKVDIDHKRKTVVLHAKEYHTNRNGWLQGAIGDIRDCITNP